MLGTFLVLTLVSKSMDEIEIAIEDNEQTMLMPLKESPMRSVQWTRTEVSISTIKEIEMKKDPNRRKRREEKKRIEGL